MNEERFFRMVDEDELEASLALAEATSDPEVVDAIENQDN